jgi:hypothetical protein
MTSTWKCWLDGQANNNETPNREYETMATATKTRKAKAVSFSAKLHSDSIVINLNLLNGKPLPEEKALAYFKSRMEMMPDDDYAIRFEGDWDDFAFGDTVEHCGTYYEVSYNDRFGYLMFYNDNTNSICDAFLDACETTINTMI